MAIVLFNVDFPEIPERTSQNKEIPDGTCIEVHDPKVSAPEHADMSQSAFFNDISRKFRNKRAKQKCMLSEHALKFTISKSQLLSVNESRTRVVAKREQTYKLLKWCQSVFFNDIFRKSATLALAPDAGPAVSLKKKS